ncbi:MAG: LysM peptidoglycan-binding domain-containing protein [Micavibrio aeruginosavorus]|uniref:LysM peptidoglycan-binding domain-containing protein n=1 Tax=Micavibrio aeruginosavorus TaxID=349221 RepID=A0A7T5R3K8_9BACT|nr:MAG: LysM peptidoglycan-binding domain-containing protein [Micavibrio aeruginosavorus]
MTSLSPATTVLPLEAADAATIASLSRREADPEAGEKRRRRLAAVLGIAGGLGAVLAVKSAATATAVWLGAPALATVVIGAAAAAVAAGSVEYVMKRRAARAAGRGMTADYFRHLFVESKAAKVTGLMTVLGATAPATAVMAAGGIVAALGAGASDYFGKRRDMKAAGLVVPDFSWRDLFKTINNSKNAKLAFGVSLLTALGVTALGEVLHSVPSGAYSEASVDAPVADPVGVTPVAGETAAPAPAPAVEIAVTVPPQDYIADYTLQRGDNLWDVAERLLGENATDTQVANKVHEIAALNNIADPDLVLAGDDIRLPLAAVDAAGLERVQSALPGLQAAATADLQATLTEAKAHYVPAPSPAMAPAVESVSPPAAVPAFTEAAVPAPVAAAPSVVGSCQVSETETALHFDCKLDPRALVQPGAGIDFHAAAQGEPFRVSLSANSAPMTVQEFLANHAVPEAQEAFRNDRFEPQP